jgi:hypothetical protein
MSISDVCSCSPTGPCAFCIDVPHHQCAYETGAVMRRRWIRPLSPVAMVNSCALYATTHRPLIQISRGTKRRGKRPPCQRYLFLEHRGHCSHGRCMFRSGYISLLFCAGQAMKTCTSNGDPPLRPDHAAAGW